MTRKQFCSNEIHFETKFSQFLNQSANFGSVNTTTENELLINHLFFAFKMYVYFSQDTRILQFAVLKAKKKVRKIQEEIAKNNAHKTQEFHKKWNVLQHL